MTTFKWTISARERAANLVGLTDVVKVIHWRYEGTNENGVTAETYGATTIGDPDPQNFIPYDTIAPEDYVSWLESILGAEPELKEGDTISKSTLVKLQENIEAQIELLVNPKIIIDTSVLNPTTSTTV